jgi:uncharacterized protein
MRYLDASLLVAALTKEAETERMHIWLGEQAKDTLHISDWVMAEFYSALSMKLRMGQLAIEERAASLAAFKILAKESLRNLSVEKMHFERAAQYATQYELGLRAGDALHLAIAGACGAEICTLDKRLAQAGKTCSVLTKLV